MAIDLDEIIANDIINLVGVLLPTVLIAANELCNKEFHLNFWCQYLSWILKEAPKRGDIFIPRVQKNMSEMIRHVFSSLHLNCTICGAFARVSNLTLIDCSADDSYWWHGYIFIKVTILRNGIVWFDFNRLCVIGLDFFLFTAIIDLCQRHQNKSNCKNLLPFGSAHKTSCKIAIVIEIL